MWGDLRGLAGGQHQLVACHRGEVFSAVLAQLKSQAKYSRIDDHNYTTWSRRIDVSSANPQDHEKY